ncbi:MAG TPA: DNA methyltransferase [Thiotrichaceae bacterium]|nr:DNA methyltransferase [Thiotrichaceae bacterium]
MTNPINQYLNQIQINLNTGVAKEHTHRPALVHLLETLFPAINAINEPKRIECGSPDLVILDTQADNMPLGYLEAKDIGVSLENALKTEQLERYLESLHNLILTDYLEFRWFVEGQSQMTVRLAEVDKAGILKPLPTQFADFQRLLDIFIHAQVITIRNPEELAARMAKIARLMRGLIFKAYQQEKTGALHNQFESFRKVLMDSLTVETFADMYAQTVCYGLFAAKCSALNQPFSRIIAGHYVPKTNPFLRNLFSQIVGIELDERLIWAVEHLVVVLNHADIADILKDFGKQTRQKDAVLHFYETFLKHYDPTMREMRGVYYTPEPVVSYIVRSVDILLKQRFKLREGLADNSRLKSGKHQVQILDPAVGTGTFLYAVFNQIFSKFMKNKGLWSTYVSEHLLPRVHGFELLMAPYTVAHIKLGLQLQEMGYQFDSDERLRIFLTNTLEEAFEKGSTPTLPFMEWLLNEGRDASDVKRDSPVMVIIGNPPYSGHSANVGGWIINLLKGLDERQNGAKIADYFQVDGKPLKERNSKWLNDDYVKFIRFAQWRIEQTGYGILGFITNHGYLDNPTFRGMRQALMQDFDEIYVLDLHGNSKKKEKSPDGSLDKNVFDIQQGVAISLFVKHQSKQATQVFHAELWGKRESKYAWLEKQDVKTTHWEELKPTSPFYLFIPQNTTLREEYEHYWKVTDVMPVNSTGMVSKRDSLAFQFEKESVKKIVEDIFKLSESQIVENYPLSSWSSRDGKIEYVKQSVVHFGIDESRFVQALYRPFDKRWTYYTSKSKGFIAWPVYDVMQHMLAGKNVGLIFMRQVALHNAYSHFGVTRNIIDNRAFYSNKGIMSLAPLYIYPTTDLLDSTSSKRKPNFSPNFIKDIATDLKLQFIDDGTGDLTRTFGPEDIFHYLYAVFHSPTYRERYAEFLKIDFPRLPLTRDKTLFQQLAKLGSQLVTIHLMEADIDSDSSYPIEGDNLLEKITYKNEKVYINKTQYFEHVTEAVWQCHIGGYQVCQKWLKDRKGRQLSYDECNHYLYILAALEQTLDLMAKIDQTIPEFPLP